MSSRRLAPVGVLALAIAVTAMVRVGVAGQAQARPATPWTPPRTSWGDPDFDGTWNYATMTPLERPNAMAGKDVLTAEEAAAYERQTIERQGVTNNTAGPDWWDPGTQHLTNRRTWLIVDPPGTENAAFSVPEIVDLRGRMKTVASIGDFSQIGRTARTIRARGPARCRRGFSRRSAFRSSAGAISTTPIVSAPSVW